MRTARIDLWALAGALLAAGMLRVYVAVMHQQGDEPLVWFTSGLAAGAGLAGYGALRAVPGRRLALSAAAALLGGLGVLGLLTIGLPIVVAAGCCLVAALAPARSAHRGGRDGAARADDLDAGGLR